MCRVGFDTVMGEQWDVFQPSMAPCELHQMMTSCQEVIKCWLQPFMLKHESPLSNYYFDAQKD